MNAVAAAAVTTNRIMMMRIVGRNVLGDMIRRGNGEVGGRATLKMNELLALPGVYLHLIMQLWSKINLCFNPVKDQ